MPKDRSETSDGVARWHQDGALRSVGAKMNQWLLNMPVIDSYLIAIPAIMVGSILLLGGIVLLFEPRHENGGSRSE